MQITLAVTALLGALALGLRFLRRGEQVVLEGLPALGRVRPGRSEGRPAPATETPSDPGAAASARSRRPQSPPGPRVAGPTAPRYTGPGPPAGRLLQRPGPPAAGSRRQLAGGAAARAGASALGAWLIDGLVLLVPALILFIVIVAGAVGISGDDDDVAVGAAVGASSCSSSWCSR